MSFQMPPITLHYSETLMRTVVRAFWWRTVGWSYIVVLFVTTAALAFLVATGDHSWFIGSAGTILLLGILLPVAIYYVHLRGSLGRLRRMKVFEAILETGPERFRLTSDVGSYEMPWSAIKQMWCFEHFWLLLFSAATFVTIPLADIGPDAREFLLMRVRESGGKVT